MVDRPPEPSRQSRHAVPGSFSIRRGDFAPSTMECPSLNEVEFLVSLI